MKNRTNKVVLSPRDASAVAELTERQKTIKEFHDRMSAVNHAESLEMFDPGDAERMRDRIRRETERKLGERMSGWDFERWMRDLRKPVIVGGEEDDGA